MSDTALIPLTVSFSGGRHIDTHGEQATPHFAITAAMATRPDGRIGLAGHGRSLVHIRSGLVVTSSGWVNMARFAAELEKLPIDWPTFKLSTLTAEHVAQMRQTERAVSTDGDGAWPWPEWAGDDSRPAHSLLGLQLADAVKFPDRFRKISEFRGKVGVFDDELGKSVDAHLLAAHCQNHAHHYGLIYVLAVLARLDSAAADLVARNLVSAWEDGSTIDEFLWQWRTEFAEQRPLTLQGFVDLPIVTPAGASSAS